MITIIFAIICLVFIAYLLNKVWKLESKLRKKDKRINAVCDANNRWIDRSIKKAILIDELQSKLSLAGKNYIEKTNSLKEEIRLLNTKLNDKNNSKKKTRQAVESKNKGKRKLRSMS